jgi:polysaccharide pyruvyl transferase WcaK-like protein
MNSESQAGSRRAGTRICVEHSGMGTLGDIAMLRNVTRKLREQLPDTVFSFRGDEVRAYIPLIDGDGTFQGLQDYYEGVKRWFVSGPHKLFPKKGRARALDALIVLATWRLLAAARFERLLGSKALCPREARSFFAAIRESRLLFSAGGGGMTDAFLYDDLFAPCAEAMVAKVLGKPVVFSGQGIGPIRCRLGKKFARRGLSAACCVTFRERESLGTAGLLGVKGPQLLCTGDDAHDLPVSQDRVKSARKRLEEMFEATPRQIIAVNARWAAYAESEGQDPGILLDVCRAVGSAPGVGIIFVPMLTNDSAEVAAYRVVQEKLCGSPPSNILCDLRADPVEAKACVAASDLAVGMSYHFLLFALSSGVPGLGLYASEYYRQKLEGEMERYGCTESVVDLRRSGWRQDLNRCFLSIMDRYHDIASTLRGRQEALSREIGVSLERTIALARDDQ